MNIRLGSKIGLTYLLIIFTTMTAFGYLTLTNIEQSLDRKSTRLNSSHH